MRRSVLEKLSVNELQLRVRASGGKTSAKNKAQLVGLICKIQDMKRLEMESIIEGKHSRFHIDLKRLGYFAQELNGVHAESWDYDYGCGFVQLFEYNGTPEEIAAELDRLVPEVDRFQNYVDGGKINFGKRLKDSDLVPMMKAVSGKPWTEWTKADIDIIKDTLEGAMTIHWTSTTDSNLPFDYEAFTEQLKEFLKENIALRPVLDPHVVIADALDPHFDHEVVIREIDGLVFPDCVNETVPEKTNPSEKAFVWSFQTFGGAQHFIRSLKEKIPAIRLMYIQSDHPVSLL